MEQHDPWVSLAQAAVLLKTTRHFVLKMAAAGQLETQLIANRIVVTRASIEKAIERMTDQEIAAESAAQQPPA